MGARVCAALQELAQRAVQSYLRSVHLQPNRAVFNVAALPLAEFALSLGLASTPKLRFLRQQHQHQSQQQRQQQPLAPSRDGGAAPPAADAGRRAGGTSSGSESEGGGEEELDDAAAAAERPGTAGELVAGSGSDDDDFMVVKRRTMHDVELPPQPLPEGGPCSPTKNPAFPHPGFLNGWHYWMPSLTGMLCPQEARCLS